MQERRALFYRKLIIHWRERKIHKDPTFWDSDKGVNYEHEEDMFCGQEWIVSPLPVCSKGFYEGVWDVIMGD